MTLSKNDVTTLAGWDAVETSEQLRRKEVRPAEVLDAAIARAEEARHLGAIVTATYDRARMTATGDGPLSGVPTFVKDLAQIKGVKTTWGTRAIRNHVSRKTDGFARRFEETGLVTLGKSASPELGLTATTEPLGREPCRNPWDPSRSTGGSSGGAASLVAAGVVAIAHASDGGGSIRIPASCCGLVGLKPSRFRLDMEGSNLLPVNIATDGVVTRTVRDTIAFYEAVELRHPPARLPRIRGLGSPNSSSGRPLRIGVFVDSPIGTPVDPEVRDAVLAAGRLCEELGHHVETIRCPFDGSVIEDFLRFWGLVAWLQVRTGRLLMSFGFDRSKLEPWTLGLAEYFLRDKLRAWAAVRRLRGFSRRYAELLGPHDVLLSPTLAEPAPRLGYLATNLDFTTMFDRLRAYAPFTPIQNIAGAPAISLPLGRSATGLPIGAQFAAARGNDMTLLELALSIEEAKPWEKVAPRAGYCEPAGR